MPTFERPSAIKPSTSRSRGLSRSRGAAWRGLGEQRPRDRAPCLLPPRDGPRDELAHVHDPALPRYRVPPLVGRAARLRIRALRTARRSGSRRLWDVLASLQGSPRALVAEVGRQADVDDRYVRALLHDRSPERRRPRPRHRSRCLSAGARGRRATARGPLACAAAAAGIGTAPACHSLRSGRPPGSEGKRSCITCGTHHRRVPTRRTTA
jgi:hypothetical protein